MAKASASRPEPLEGLRVDVAALRRRGTDRERISVELPSHWLNAALSQTDAKVGDPGHVQIELVLPTDGAVVATGHLEFAFTVPCGRCLEPAAVDGNAALSGTYVVGSQLPAPSGSAGEDEGEEGLGLTEDDLETFLYDGSTLQLDDMVLEQVKLAYPMRALCERGERCRGLCSNCGHDLNTQPGSVEDRGRCAQCGRPTGPMVGDPKGAQNAASDEDGPLAAALRKLQFD